MFDTVMKSRCSDGARWQGVGGGSLSWSAGKVSLQCSPLSWGPVLWRDWACGILQNAVWGRVTCLVSLPGWQGKGGYSQHKAKAQRWETQGVHRKRSLTRDVAEGLGRARVLKVLCPLGPGSPVFGDHLPLSDLFSTGLIFTELKF